MNCVELFAGSGGASLGLETAGFSHLACVENNEDACATLREAGLPCVEGDVRDLSLYDGMAPDLLWSSYPCQAWSTAGKRKGAQDERNGWPWTVDVIDLLGPEFFVGENVTGLLEHRGGCTPRCLGADECPRAYFDLVIMEQLRERFAWVGFRVVNASSWGVPQHRRRVVIMAGPRPIKWPEPTHGEPGIQDDLFGRALLPWTTAGEAIGLSGIMHTGGEDYRERSDRKTRERPAPTTEPSPTVGGRGNTMITQLSPAVRRRLTVEECAALQGFPEGYPFQGTKESRFIQIGNAVPPRLAEVIGIAILRSAR